MPSPEHTHHHDQYRADIPRDQLSAREQRIIQILEVNKNGTKLAQEGTIFKPNNKRP
jgi:hypothetical protein